MKHSCFLLLIFSIATHTLYAHQDFYTTRDFGNIKVRIKTGYNYEEINKVMMIGELARKMCSGLNYSKTVFLDFEHDYTKACSASYFVSYDKGKIIYTCGNCGENEYLHRKAIVIRQINQTFDAMTTLKLLEYAIGNKEQIIAAQIETNYDCRNWRINSIDPNSIKNILSAGLSTTLSEILKIKVYRFEKKEFKYGISYYWHENKYHFFYRDYKKPDKVVLSLDDVYMFERFSDSYSFIFDSDKSFYYQFAWPKPSISKRHIIGNAYADYRIFTIKDIDRNKYSISFSAYTGEMGVLQPRDFTLIYLVNKDELIQDLDKLLEKEN